MRCVTVSIVLIVPGLLLTGLSGCAEAPVTGPDVCSAASQHLADCLGQAPATDGGSCDEAHANRILESECSALTTAVGKGDAWWCTPWSGPWVVGCGGGSSWETETETTGSLVGSIDYAWDNFGSQISSMSCALVVLTDARGEEVGRTHTSVHGGFAFDGALEEAAEFVAKPERWW